jgi:hypothetical protein
MVDKVVMVDKYVHDVHFVHYVPLSSRIRGSLLPVSESL